MATARANDVGRHLRQLFGPGQRRRADRQPAAGAVCVRGRAGSTRPKTPRRRSRRSWPGTGRRSLRLPPGARRRPCRRGRLPGDIPGTGPPRRFAAGARQRFARRVAPRRGVPDGPQGAQEHAAAGGRASSGWPGRRRGPACASPRWKQADLGAALHAEVTRLPAKYRAPVVLCYFEGRTHDEAAAALALAGRDRSAAGYPAPATCSGPGSPAVAWRRARPGGNGGRRTRAARAEVPATLLHATLDAAMRGAPAGAAAALAGLVLESLLAAQLRTGGDRAGPGRDDRRPGACVRGAPASAASHPLRSGPARARLWQHRRRGSIPRRPLPAARPRAAGTLTRSVMATWPTRSSTAATARP